MTLGRTLIHEGGHVVAAHVLHARVSQVTVFGNREGHTRFSVLREAALDHATILLAGRSAENWFGFGLSGAVGSDHARALAVARRAAWPNIAALDAVAEEMLVRAQRRADRLVRANDREIEWLATALAAGGGRLAGDELQSAIFEAFASSWQRDLPRQVAVVSRPAT